MSKSKCIKHTNVGPLLEVEMSKKCTPMWLEAHFQVKSVKKLTVPDHLDVEMMKKWTLLWREADFQVNMHEARHARTTFGSCDVEKVHAIVARSTCRSQNVQSTPAPDHFWKLSRRKSARRCGAKHISKSKCIKHTMRGPLLKVQMWSWYVQGILHLAKSEQNVRFCSISKNDGRRGTFAEDLQRCNFCGSRNTRGMFIRAVRRSWR